MDRFLDEELRKRLSHRANKIFIRPQGTPEFKPFCDICKRYMIYIRDKGYECPICGNEYKDQKEESETLTSIKEVKPRVYSVKANSKNKWLADFPKGATIIHDSETRF